MIEVKYFSSVWTHIFFSAVTAIEINDQIDQNKDFSHHVNKILNQYFYK